MIPVKWEDQTLKAITYLRSQLPAVTFTRTKQDVSRQVVLDTEPQQLETPISRRVTILLESWVVRANGTADVAESYKLMSDALFELQRAPHIVRFDSPIGPRVAKDDAGFEYHEGSLVWVVAS